MPRRSKSFRVDSISETARYKPWAEPGAAVVTFLPKITEHPEPGGGNWTSRKSLPPGKWVGPTGDQEQVVGVLFQLLITEVQKSQLQPHHLKYVLDLGPHARFRPILRPLLFVNPVLIAVATVRVVLRPGCAFLDHLSL